MDEFIKEVHSMPTIDLQLIIDDQKDLYSDEEYQILLDELKSRPSNAVEIEAYEQEQREVEREQAEYARAVAEQKERKINALKQKHLDGYWEYKVLSLMDEQTGGINPSSIEGSLNELALDGWHLKCAFTNELGQNTSSSGFGGITTGTNATIDQNILILERYIKIQENQLRKWCQDLLEEAREEICD